jgi:hypothetical protein
LFDPLTGREVREKIRRDPRLKRCEDQRGDDG